MVTIGDILSVIAFLVGLGGTAWAMTVAMGLLFPERVASASGAAQGAFVRGLPLLLLGFVSLSLLKSTPGVKLLGFLMLLGLLALATLGFAGLARVAGRRLTLLQPDMGEYPAFLRGAGFLVAACLFPLLGWFLFAPALFVTALGAGWRGLTARAAVLREA